MPYIRNSRDRILATFDEFYVLTSKRRSRLQTCVITNKGKFVGFIILSLLRFTAVF